ncbi:hypothetical protein C8J57DRAFT_348089 [Mycena rebaudengoi]|nr:hypothetical protein C8J57DRAFT_348089 [Mycena rebaudengoi]
MCEFDACERNMTILRARTPFVSPPPVRPSHLPAWPERRVRHVLRLPPLPAARASLLRQHDTEHDLLSHYEATTRLLDASRAYGLTTCAVHRHRRRTTSTPSTPDPRAPQIRSSRRCCSSSRAPPSLTPRVQRRSSAESPLSVFSRPRLRAPQLGCATPPPCAAPPASVPHRIYRFFASRRSPNYNLHHYAPGARRPSAAQLPVRPPCGTSHRLSFASSVPASLECGVRHPPGLPAAPVVAGDRLQHHHTARECAPQPRPTPPAVREARDARVRRPPRRLGRVPALRDRLDQCTTLTARRPRLPRSSVPSATRPPRATVVPYRRRLLRRLLNRHHHLLSSLLDARGWAYPQHTDVPSTRGGRSPPRTLRSSLPRAS